MNAGTFPKPNYNNGTQYIASIPQPTKVREDVVRIDHAINSKYQLMGHYLHDTLLQNYFPPLWGDSTYPTVGTIMTNPSFTAVIKLTQTYTPNLLNETGIFYSGNKITLTPTAGPGGTFLQPSGWTATSFFPVADAATNDMPEIDLQGSPLNVNWSESYYPWKNGYEGFEYRDDLSWTKGRHQLKFGFSPAARLQEPATAGQHPGDRGFQLEQLFRRLVYQFPARGRLQLYPTAVPVRQTLGQQQLRDVFQR